MPEVHDDRMRDVWAEPVVVPRQPVRQLSARPGGSVVALERVWDHGRLAYAPGDVIPHEDAVRLGLAEPLPEPPPPRTFAEHVAAGQRARRRRFGR